MRAYRDRRPGGLLFALVVGLAACGAEGGGTGSDGTTGPSTTSTAPPTTSVTDPSAATTIRSYFLRDEKVGPVGRDAMTESVATEAMEGLLTGPTSTEQDLGFTSAIPAGTELLGLTVDSGIAVVDLSSEFAAGGGSASMMGRVAQVVFTLTQFPTAEAVTFELEGEVVTAIGGEGLLLTDPQTRADWEDLSPAILVESPLPFAQATSPLRILGTANTFEAAFQVNVTDGEGLIVYDEPATATSGTGTRGTFDITATFDVPRSGIGAVIVFEYSARDGSPINIVEVPIQVLA